VTAKHLAAPCAFEADHEVPAIRSVDGNGGFGSRRPRRCPKYGKRSMHAGDQARKLARLNPVVCDVAENDLDYEARIDRFGFSHLFLRLGVE
jgi:hypothetical protein